MNSDPEHQLVELARKGDRQAQQQLIVRHQAAVVRAARALCGPLVAEDLAQEAFVRALVGLSRFRGQSSVRTWLLRIVSNLCVDHLRRRRSRPLEPSGCSGDDDSPAVLAERREREQAVRQAIASLPSGQRLAVLLCYIDGQSHEQAARQLGTSRRAIEGKLYRARRTLARDLGWIWEG